MTLKLKYLGGGKGWVFLNDKYWTILLIDVCTSIRNMLHGPWKEVDAPTVTLQIDDANVNSEAISMSLAYLYGQHPKLNNSNAFRVLAAASFLDLQVRLQ